MATTAAKNYELQSTGSNAGAWGSVLNTDVFQIVDKNVGGIATKGLTNINVTLTADEAENLTVRLTGTLTGNVIVTTSCIGFFFVDNATTGAFTVDIYNGVGSAIRCPQGYRVVIISDGTNGCRLGNDPPASAYVALSVGTAALAANAVTFPKIQNINTSTLLGRTTASSGNVEEISPGTGLTLATGTLSVTTPAASTLISTTTVSAASALVITSGFSSSFDEYELHVSSALVATNGTSLILQVSSNGGSSYYSTSYKGSYTLSNSGGTVTGAGSGTSQLELSGNGGFGVSNSSSYSWRGLIRIWPNGSTTRKNVVYDGSYMGVDGSNFTQIRGGGIWDGGNDAINAIRIAAASGNISATVRLIGIKNT